MKHNLLSDKELGLLSHIGFYADKDNLVFGRGKKTVNKKFLSSLQETCVVLSTQVSINHSLEDSGNTKFKRNNRFNTYPAFIWVDLIKRDNPDIKLKDLLFILKGLIAFQDKNKKFSDEIHHRFNESVKCTPNLNDEWISRITRSHSW